MSPWTHLVNTQKTYPRTWLKTPDNPGAVKPPYASGRDWSRVEKELEKELDDKKEGEQALNEMFQKIYGDANDDVRYHIFFCINTSPCYS